MTDNEIIKALESFIQDWIIGYYDDEEIIVADVLSLINRQRAEIERLENGLAISRKETKRYIAFKGGRGFVKEMVGERDD